MENRKYMYHIHRKYNNDEFWQVGNTIIVDENFEAIYWQKLLQNDYILKERYGDNYDIDYIISTMEEIEERNFVEDEISNQVEKYLISYYFLRREQALEEGRKLYAPDAPRRYNCIFLSNRTDLFYWKKVVGDYRFQKFLLELEGKTFTTSDKFFPSHTLTLENQVEASKDYWKPKIKEKTPHQETLFQGTAKIIK